jgi:hypothetical protein
MPLRKVKGGWMWGSKGPFASKAKALAVARAAYASGYKEQTQQSGQDKSVRIQKETRHAD